MDEGKLWSLIRNVLTQGGAIQLDRASMSSYEEYSARLDAAAAERVADFTKLADARIAELERDIERLDAQWREELRIYRETDGVDAERYRYLRGQAPLVPGECKHHIAVHVYDWARSFNQSDRLQLNMWSQAEAASAHLQHAVGVLLPRYVELSGDRLDAEIDAARANGGGV